jgi:hypothetical protein
VTRTCPYCNHDAERLPMAGSCHSWHLCGRCGWDSDDQPGRIPPRLEAAATAGAGLFRQCRLRQLDGGVSRSLIAYVPAHLAARHSPVQIRGRDGSWSPLWVVEMTFGPAFDGHHRDHQRSSDIRRATP